MGNYVEEQLIRGQSSRGQLSGDNYSGWGWGAILLGGNYPGGHCPWGKLSGGQIKFLWRVSVFTNCLTIPTGKNCFFQFSARMAGWLLLTVLICLQNQLSSIIDSVTRIKSTEKCDSSNRQQKWMVAPSSRFYGKIWVGFCLNIGKRFLLEVSF